MSTIHTHTRLTALCPGLPRWAGTRKVKPIWISLNQETVSGSGISWAICKSALRSRQITTPAPHRSVFYRPDALPAAQPTASKHCTEGTVHILNRLLTHYFTPGELTTKSHGCGLTTWFLLVDTWIARSMRRPIGNGVAPARTQDILLNMHLQIPITSHTHYCMLLTILKTIWK